MAFEFTFPDVGEGIQEGELKKWLVKEGDTVTVDQHVAQVETDKAVVEMPSPKAGVISKLHYAEGDTIQVGAVFITIAEDGESVAETSSSPQETQTSAQTESKPEPTAQEVIEAAHKEAEDPNKPKEKYTGSVVGFLEDAKEVSPIISQSEHHESSAKTVKATLMVRQLAKQKGIDLTTITGTGPDGTITKQDVEQSQPSTTEPTKEENHSSQQEAPASTTSQPISTPVEMPEPTKPSESTQASPDPSAQTPKKHVRKYDFYGYLDRKPLKGMKKAIAKHMSESFFGSPQVTNFHSVDVTALEELRARHKKSYAQQGIKLTTLAYIVKAVAKTLPHHPLLNAMMEDEDIVSKKYYNIGIAVDVDDGLLVPVIKRANTKTVQDIAKEIVELATKARSHSLDMMDMKGGTFTISNLGSLGVEHFTPILNSPESALLGIGTTKEEPKVIDGQVVVRKIMPLSMTFDHRIVNGGQAARFVQELNQYLEFPGMLEQTDD